MKILVSGGNGYIGCALVETLLRNYNAQVTVYDNLMYGQDGLVPFSHYSNFNFVYGDVRDWTKLSKHVEEADVIFPLAAIVGFPACDRDPTLAYQVNCEQIVNICHAWRTGQKIILPNSNSGYGEGKDGICTEETPLNPISVYGTTKCKAENYLLQRTDGISLRLATLFGCSYRMRLDLLVNDFTYKAITDGYIVLFEKHFKRNYIHIRDVVKAFLHLMDNYDQYKKNVYNVGLSSANLNKEELCLKIKEYVPNFSIQEDNIREDPDKRNYIVSNDKLEKTGWKPDYSLDDGIQELIKAYRILGKVNRRYGNN